MTQVMVRYKVKPDRVVENEQLVDAVYAELRAAKPDGLRYVTFRLDDGVTFIHLSLVESDDGQNPLPRLEAFQRFQDKIAERCDDPPVVTRIREVGSYRVFGDDRT